MPDLREDVLHAVDIVDVVSKWVKLKKVGKNRSGLCPFHKEHTPSFTVAEDKQIFKCFGCGKGGNVITFLMEIERIDFRDALTTLAREQNIDVSSYQRASGEKNTHEKQEKKDHIKTVNKLTQDFFVHAFEDSHIAREYVYEKRKLTDDIVKRFGIGYAPESHYKLIDFLRNKGCEPDHMVQAGVVKEGTAGGDRYAFFRDRVTFPIRDHFGTIAGFGGRSLHPDQMPKYLNTTETPLYDKSKILFGMDLAKQQLNMYGHLIIVEGYMDVIALHQYGLPIAVATCGTALTQQHIKLLQRHTEKIVFLFDNDAAGREATIRALKIAFQADLFPLVFPLPEQYKDIDEYLTAQGRQVTLEELQPSFVDAFAYVIEKLSKQYPPHLPGERKKLTTLLFDILIYVQDYSMLLFYLEMMAKPLGVTADALLPQYKRYHIQQRNTAGSPVSGGERSRVATTSSYHIDEETLLQALLYNNFRIHLELEDQAKTDLSHLFTIVQDLFLILHITPGMPEQAKDSEGKEQADTALQIILESQLRWEQQITPLQPSKRYHHLQHFITTYLNKRVRASLSDKTLGSEEKQKLLILSKSINTKK